MKSRYTVTVIDGDKSSVICDTTKKIEALNAFAEANAEHGADKVRFETSAVERTSPTKTEIRQQTATVRAHLRSTLEAALAGNVEQSLKHVDEARPVLERLHDMLVTYTPSGSDEPEPESEPTE